LPAALEAIWIANYQAARTYVPKPYPGRVTLFRCQDTTPGVYERDLGWGELALGGVDVYDVPGDHNSLITEPHVRVVADRLRECLCTIRELER
jgi:thioesterase domain-containing protein